MADAVILKPGKDKPIRNRHHWIFSGAVQHAPAYENGSILPVADSQGKILGHAYFNRDTVITGRMLSWGAKNEPLGELERRLEAALQLRLTLFKGKDTNCFRLINGEGDSVPGLIADLYNRVLVLQVSTLGMEKLKDRVVEMLQKLSERHDLKLECIYERSKMPARKREGLGDFDGVLWGELPENAVVTENGVRFNINFRQAHKTGLYLDQREMRAMIGELAPGRNVLNCCSYTGGFSLYAARAGAKAVTSVDISSEIVEQARQNFELNGLAGDQHQFISSDVFDYLRARDLSQFNLIILDPPAFAKKEQDVPKALNAYGELNRLVLKSCAPGTFLLTCSCSYHVNAEMFQHAVFKAAASAGRNVKIISHHRQALDHVLNIYHPEMDYLKSLLLYVE